MQTRKTDQTAQACLSIRWVHISKGEFSHIAAQILTLEGIFLFMLKLWEYFLFWEFALDSKPLIWERERTCQFMQESRYMVWEGMYESVLESKRLF